MWIALLIPAVIFSAIAYREQKKTLLKGIDEKLYVAAVMLKGALGVDYHDNLSKDSFTKADYDRIIVDRNNRLCRELELQYLWSCMVVDGDIVFTTSTSPGKDVTKDDHATFFAVHRDPHAFDGVFGTMQPNYSSFHNEWGHGRMVLVPYVDKNGRAYCFGASMGINEVDAILRSAILNYFLFSLVVLLGGFVVSSVIANSFVRPMVTLTKVTKEIAHGKLDQRAEAGGSREVQSLSESINFMSSAIQDKITALEEGESKLRDLSKDLEKKVQERTKELRTMQEKLIRTEKLAVIGKFAGSIAHELRNPLNAIKASAFFIKTKLAQLHDDKVTKHLALIDEEIVASNKIITDILSFARVKEPCLKEENINDLLRESLTKLNVPKGIEVISELDDTIPLVSVDALQLIQVFNNVILNAMDAMPQGGKLTISSFVHEDFVVADFQDTGGGISEENLGKIFEPLFSTKAKGTGLGLSTCRSIMEIHAGSIDVESTLGKGTKIMIRLPLSKE